MAFINNNAYLRNGRYLIEGQIAAGKTSFIRSFDDTQLSERNIRVSKEPTSLWCNSPVGNLLARATEDPLNRVSMFQVGYKLFDILFSNNFSLPRCMHSSHSSKPEPQSLETTFLLRREVSTHPTEFFRRQTRHI